MIMNEAIPIEHIYMASRPVDLWSYVKKTDTDFRESADTANSTKDFLRFLP